MILIDKQYRWHKADKPGAECHFAGWFYDQGHIYAKTDAASRIIDIVKEKRNVEDVGTIIRNISGNFAFILHTGSIIIAAVDKIRSYPIFYCRKNDSIGISNSARILKAQMGLAEWNQESLIEYKMSGYVNRQNTLFKDLKQLLAGELLVIDTGTRQLATYRYYQFLSRDKKIQSEDQWIEELDSVTEETFQILSDSLKNRPVWIPLSGGLDSRLVLAMLLHIGYEDLTTFSYGPPGNWEAKVAEQISAYAGVKWVSVPYTRKMISNIHKTKICEEFYAYADGLSSVPSIPDLYALLYLKENQIIPGDAVIVNGNSGDFITGEHIPKAFKSVESCPRDFLCGLILEKHFSLWKNLKTQNNNEILKKKLNELIGSYRTNDDVQIGIDLFECWEWQERQAKLVINGVRVYDFLEFEWRLPLWSDEYLFFWDKVPWQHKMDQKLYRKYLKKVNPSVLFNQNWKPYYPTPKALPIVLFAIRIASLFSRKGYNALVNKYLKYFMYYGPYYAHLSYRSYLRRSENHRNPLSFRVIDALRNIESETTQSN